MKKQHVLFICTHNSCRSQMAEGLLNQYCGNRFQAYSAGVKKTHVHPLAIQVMKEIDIDISRHRSKLVDEFKEITFDVVVTVCDQANETCPFFPGKKVIHNGFFDPGTIKGPKEEKLNAFRNVRDEIKQWIMDYFCMGEEDL
ncbi:MAG: arsenate reductase ArsC [Candidatus Thermoplasmatota archaeon]|nr:arsenate reductase ArsC [Candidatus Thermoplasmatota archaeon]MBS3802432.1 arsenate reductase ArsC [Candidatus Thermoplasmatota archaeon]